MTSSMKKYIYADNAATTPLDPEAFDAALPYWREEYGNPSSRYSFSRSAQKAVAQARTTIAECIGAQSDEIYFTSGGSESDNWAIRNLAYNATRFENSGKQILVSAVEHHAILNSVQESGRLYNCPYSVLPVDSMGRILRANYYRLTSGGVAGVSVMLANNETGTIEAIAELSAFARDQGFRFHTDAVQAVGHIPVDVRELGVDLLSASAHKFNGPKGVGFLYVRRGYPLTGLIHGGGQESGFRAGTENVPGIVAMAVALKNNCNQNEQTTAKLRQMERLFREQIQRSVPQAVFNGNPDSHLPGHISVSFPRTSGESLLHILDLKGIAVSTGAACNSQTTEISHVLKAIGLSKEMAKGTIRITFGKYNTDDEAATIAKTIARIETP